MVKSISAICIILALLVLGGCNSPLSLANGALAPATGKAVASVSYSSLQAKANGLFVSAATGSTPLVADASAAGDAQWFVVVTNADATISFQSKASSLYVTVDSSQSNKLVAN